MSDKHGRMSEDQALQENSVFWSKKRAMAEQEVKNWSQVDIGGKQLIDIYEKNPKKARYIAESLKMQEKVLSKMSETTLSTAFGANTRPETVLRSVFLGNANSNRGNIFNEMALSSTDDALIYIRSVRNQTLRGSTAGDRTYETINPFYSGEQFNGAIGTGNGALTNFVSAPMNPVPLIPFSIQITVGGALVAQDNGSGVLVGALLDPALENSVDYATGVITLNFLAAVANGVDIRSIFKWNSETPGNANQWGRITLQAVKERFNARPMPLGYSFTDMTQLVFESTGMGNFDEMVAQAVGDAHAMDKDYRAIALANRIALSNPQFTFNTNFAAVGEVSFESHAQRVLNEIGRVSSAIYDDIKRGSINKIVAGANATNYLKNHKLWKDDMGDKRTGVYKAGSLSDIEVFQCPADGSLIASNEMLLTYKNDQEGMDISMITGTLAELDASLRYPTMYTEGYTASVEDTIVVNRSFIRKMTLAGL